MSTPREHHTRFAHEALARLGLMGNPRALDILTTPMGQPFLLDIWEQVSAGLPKAQNYPPNGLHPSIHNHADKRVIVVSMPRPEAPGEPWMAAFVTVPEKRKMLVFKSEAVMRYFVLTHEGAGTHLWEHKTDGGKIDLGAGPAPEAPTFAAHLGSIC